MTSLNLSSFPEKTWLSLTSTDIESILPKIINTGSLCQGVNYTSKINNSVNKGPALISRWSNDLWFQSTFRLSYTTHKTWHPAKQMVLNYRINWYCLGQTCAMSLGTKGSDHAKRLTRHSVPLKSLRNNHGVCKLSRSCQSKRGRTFPRVLIFF